MRLALLGGIVAFGFLLLIFIARAIGTSQPLPEAVRALHLTDCDLPCWNGITVGQTPLRAAYPQVVSQFDAASRRFLADSRIVGTTLQEAAAPTTEVELVYDDNGIVQRITLYVSASDDLRLGDMLNLFGEPSEIGFRQPVLLFYQCEGAYAAITADTRRGIGWQAPIGMITITGFETLRPLVPCTANDPARASE
jgi:hypothetical protein